MSILGHINLVKMIIIAKINYLSYILPCALPISLMKEYNKSMEYFIWQGKKPLFNRTKLYSAKSSGGLSLLRTGSTVLFHPHSWLKLIYTAPKWIHIERDLLAPFSGDAFLTQTAQPISDQNQVLIFVRGSWTLYHQNFKQRPWLTPRASIWYNTKLRINKKPFFWIQWANKGICFLDDLYKGEHVVSFNHLKQKYNLLNNDFWKCL